MGKSLLFLLVSVCVFSVCKLNAQIIFQDDFDSYIADSIIDPQSPHWTGWGNALTSAYVSDDTAASGNNSLKIWNASVPGSNVDLSDIIYHLGNKTSGRYLLTFKVYVPSHVNGVGAGTYWNMLHVYNNSAASVEWAFQVFLRPIGQLSRVEVGRAIFAIPVQYDKWVKVAHIVDLDRDLHDFYYDGQLIMSQRFSQQPFNTNGTLQLAAIDFFAHCGAGNCVELGYFDDFIYKDFPDQYNDAGLTNLNVSDYCTGYPVNIDVTVKNFGFDTINSVSINWSVDGVLQSPVLYSSAAIFPNSTATVNLGSYTFNGTAHEIKAWTSNPNMNIDSVNFNDTLEVDISKPVITGPDSLCSSTDFTISVSSSGTGVTYDWQYLDTSSNWVSANAYSRVFPINGGITSSRSHRVIVSCTGGGSDTSNIHTVILKPYLDCYCTPIYGSGCSIITADINSITLNGTNGTGINEMNTGCSPNSYRDNTNLPAIDLIAGAIHQGTINSSFTGMQVYAKIWIDFENDGIFQDSTNLVSMFGPFNTTAIPFSIALPSSLDSGIHRMRIRTVFNSPNFNFDACGSQNYGEVHDYMVKVISPRCKVPYNLNANSITSGSAAISWIEAGISTEWEIEYGIKGFAKGTGNDTVTYSNPFTLINLNPNTLYDFYIRAICGRRDTSPWIGPLTFQTDLATGENEISSTIENIFIHPNPSEEYFHIVGNQVLEEVEISIYATSGKLIYRSADKFSNNFDKRIDISNLAKGLYFVKLQSKSSMLMKKIVVQ